MTRRTLMWFAACALWGLSLPAGAATPEIEGSLWLDADQVNLSDARLVSRVLEQPCRRVIVTAFSGGQTLYPTQVDPFSQMTRYRRGETP